MPDSCGADLLANSLLPSLLGGKEFPIPQIDLSGDQFQVPPLDGDLYAEISPLTNEDLTTRVVGGTGTFDALMDSVNAHLRVEYEKNRLSGQEYTKAYIAATGAALGGAIQYLLGRDQAYWNAITAQQQARLIEVQVVKARVEIETAKVLMAAAQYQALTAEAEYGLTKMKIATEDATYCLALAQRKQVEAQTEQVEAQTGQVLYNTLQVLPVQRAGLMLDNDSKEFTNANLLPVQEQLLKEQVEVQRAQTLDTRTDGETIEGSVGKQKDLYDQQIISYQRDAEVKAAKLFSDAWITTKTLLDTTAPPGNFTNGSLNDVLAALKENNGLGGNVPNPTEP